MKRYNHLFEQITSFENILLASRKARKGKRFKQATAAFEHHLERNILKIQRLLHTRTYEPGSYRDFYIHLPKKRLISAAPYFDRVVHHALMNIVGPLINRRLIYDTYACIPGKGTHKAVARYRDFMRRNRYVLKCDIVKYFPSIDHAILGHIVEGIIKCPETLWLVRKIIASRKTEQPDYFPGDDLFTPLERSCGLPIGNLTSQFFANLYLNDFDHFIKENLKIKHYIRYCDDFVLFGNSKKQLNHCKAVIRDYLAAIRLRLHTNKSRIFRIAEGVDFLGYRIFPGYTLVRKKVVQRYRKKLRNMVKAYHAGSLGLEDVHCSLNSWIGHVQHADSWRLRTEVFSGAVF